MNTNNVNISFRKDLLKQIDQIAKEESLTRSELIREAARIYIERKNNWNLIFNYGNKLSIKKKLSEKDVLNEILKYRKSKRITS